MTILQIAQKCTQRLQIIDPTTFIGSTNNNDILLLAMINRAIDEIADSCDWPELTKQYTFKLIDGQDSYPLPGDHDSTVNQTLWNRDQHWPLIGPITPQVWEQYINGFITTLPRQRFRVKGASINQFFINPTPEGVAGQVMVYEYTSKNKRRPKNWAANTAYTTAAPYVFYNGLILKCISNGTSANNGQPPVYGIDNTVTWDPILDYVASQVYYENDYVLGNGNVYKVTTAGLSSAATPSVSSGSETLGTVVFEFQAVPTSWAGGTPYSEGDYVLNSDLFGFRCITGGVSGRLSPKCFQVYPSDTGYPPGTISKRIRDIGSAGTLVWEVYEGEYNFTADTDEVLLDNQIIIDGAVWRFLEARGFDYMSIRQIALEQLDIAKTKKEGASTVSMNGLANIWPLAIGWYSYPEGDYTPPS